MVGLISKDEIMKLSEMKQDEVNISAAQMLVLANSIVSGKEDMESIIASLEKQAWYKRMWNSFNGKMKGTAEEFAQNNGKLALYCVQAVSILVDNENFSTDMMLNIRQKLVNIYYFSTVQGIELLVGKEIVTEIRNSVSALIDKVNSVTKQLDVLTILEVDFETGKLDYDNHITTICGAISKLDNDILNDNSKLDIVRNYVNDSRIIDAPERSIEAFMYDIINVPAEMTGEVYLELATMSDNIWSEMFAELMESYNMLPKMERMAKKKDAIIKAILEKKDIDDSAEFTSEDLFDSLLATRIEMAAMTGNVCIETNAVIENCEYIEEGEKRVPVGDNPVGAKAVMTVAEKAAEIVSEFFDCDVCEEYNVYEVENDEEYDVDTSYYRICDVDTPYYHIYVDICKFVCRTFDIDEINLYINKDFRGDDESFCYAEMIVDIRNRYGIPFISSEDRKGLRSVEKIAKYIIEFLQDDADIYEDVFEAICRYFEIEIDEFEMDDDLIDDLCGDMMEIVFMMAELGEKYGIQHIPDDDLYKLRTPRKIISYIKNNR